MEIFIFFFIVVLGALIGSFLAAYTYRLPRKISISKGRSYCPKCKKQISWYDNIPLISYLLLGGKCRQCKKTISKRYPFIEFSTIIAFALIYLFNQRISLTLGWTQINNPLSIAVDLLLATIFIIIFVVDLEFQIIPDGSIFAGLLVTLIAHGLFKTDTLFIYVLTGFTAGMFLLLINLATKGRGMGLGDVKLAVFIGMLLGPINTLLWYFISFMIGGAFGVIIIAAKRMDIKDKVPFAPFLILGLIGLFVLGDVIKRYFFFL